MAHLDQQSLSSVLASQIEQEQLKSALNKRKTARENKMKVFFFFFTLFFKFHYSIIFIASRDQDNITAAVTDGWVNISNDIIEENNPCSNSSTAREFSTRGNQTKSALFLIYFNKSIINHKLRKSAKETKSVLTKDECSLIRFCGFLLLYNYIVV